MGIFGGECWDFSAKYQDFVCRERELKQGLEGKEVLEGKMWIEGFLRHEGAKSAGSDG